MFQAFSYRGEDPRPAIRNFYNLYAVTADKRFLDLARFFYHNDVIDPLGQVLYYCLFFLSFIRNFRAFIGGRVGY